MGQERFRIRRAERTVTVDSHGVAVATEEDWDRWRAEMFAAVEVARTVRFLEPLLLSSAHRFLHIGLSSWCSCGWEERKFWSETAAAQAWWEHAEPLLDWDTIEAELVVRTLAR